MYTACVLATVLCLFLVLPRAESGSPPIVGGFSFVDVGNMDVQEAARFFADELGDDWDFLEVKAAQAQVVAGTNYKLTVMVQREIASGLKKIRACEAELFRSLSQEHELTKFCCQ